MLSQDTRSVACTSVNLSCVPGHATGIERVILTAQGDLQRLLSAFFGHPIHVKCIYANTSPRTHPASPEHPITQSRQVHLVCANRVVCIATSIVTITCPESERIFLDNKFPIGQTFQELCRRPQFSLLSVETPTVRGTRELRRTYTLETEGFQTEILEVFPDRDMFTRAEDWLLENADVETQRASVADSAKLDWRTANVRRVVRQATLYLRARSPRHIRVGGGREKAGTIVLQFKEPFAEDEGTLPQIVDTTRGTGSSFA